METKNDLNEKIVLTTIKIKAAFPELTKYLDEMPEHVHSTIDKKVNSKDLKDYLNSLNQLLETFSETH